MAAIGKEVIVAVQVGGNGHSNSLRIDSNKVATVHDNADTVMRLLDAISDNQNGSVVFYLNNKKHQGTPEHWESNTQRSK